MKTAKLFVTGRSQAVRLPKEFRFSGKEVFIQRMGQAVVLLPSIHSWDILFEACKEFSDDFMTERSQPESQPRPELE
ncbi:MAG: type II toxin-antitoxin system VapB family antitoxin [Planctomycetota bacterium]